MALLKVRTYPDPVLTKKASLLTDFGAVEQKLFDDMIETMYVEDGVGIAAPQIGVSKRILIASPTMKEGEEWVIVNPEIYEASGTETGMEGCLSFPGLSGEVTRSKKIKIRFQNRHGHPQDMEIRDFFSRIIQHEMDHLDGILLIDRLKFQDRQAFLSRFQVS